MSPTVKILQPTGIFDGTQAGSFRREIADALDTDAEIILVDFQEVSFMDSSGLGALVMALKTVRGKGKKLFLCALNDQIKMLFELTSMDRVFVVYSDRAAFEQAALSPS